MKLAIACALLFGALAAAPASSRAENNAFMGHYGYLLLLPPDYHSNPAFHGAIEVADLFPEKCQGSKTRMDCAKLGMVELAAMPIRMVEESTGKPGFAAYIASVVDAAKAAGIKARVKRGKIAGFPSAVIEMPGHPQPLNTMILVKGSKVYYRFKYNAKTGAAAATSIAASIKEVAPHDNPPPPGAR